LRCGVQGANRKKPTTSADERRQAKSRESLITSAPLFLPPSLGTGRGSRYRGTDWLTTRRSSRPRRSLGG